MTLEAAQPVLVKIDGFVNEVEGWDGEDAKPLLPDIAAFAKDFVLNSMGAVSEYFEWQAPFVAPLYDGGLDLEWHIDYRKLVINIEPGNKVSYIRRVKGLTNFDKLTAPQDTQSLIDLVLWVHGRENEKNG